jgi:L-lactate dehydrogenase complex protein LldG
MKRQEFLERVRNATGRNTKAPVTRPPEAPKPSTTMTPDQLVAQFKAMNESVLGTVHVVQNATRARAALAQLLRDTTSFIRSPHAILDQLGLNELTSSLTPESARNADVGITGCEAAIAATGTVVLSSGWGRLSALLPYRHIVVLRASQIVPDLEDWYLEMGRLARLGTLPGAWGMHTGPSKSADIEQTMALGVHGPGKVDVILMLE